MYQKVTRSKLNSALNIKTVNRLILILLLLCLVPTNTLPDWYFFSKNINNSIQSVGENSITLTTIFGD